MSIELEPSKPTVESGYEHYRALSTAAVASLITGLLSVLAIFDWTLVGIPAIGVVLSIWAWLKVKRHADELTGIGFARLGFALSLFFSIVAPARLTYVYMTEVPPGYERISYSELQPDERQAGQVVPPSALALEGKKIFIKGFVYPGQERFGIREFLLVRDQGDCCFGGNPKITDRIQVRLENPLRLNYSTRLHKVGGTFHVEPAATTVGGAKGGVFYHLTADHLE